MSIKRSEYQKRLIEKVRELAGKISSRNRDVDETSEFPWDIFDVFKENHILDLPIPEDFGGGGAHSLTCCLVLEEIAHVSPAFAHMLAGHWLGYTPLELFCNPSQRETYFPRLRSEMAAFSLTEPAAGSDAGGVMTEATREGSHYLLNGTKIYFFRSPRGPPSATAAFSDPACLLSRSKATDGQSTAKGSGCVPRHSGARRLTEFPRHPSAPTSLRHPPV